MWVGVGGGCSDGVICYIEPREQEIGVLCVIEADDDDESNEMKLTRKLNSAISSSSSPS